MSREKTIIGSIGNIDIIRIVEKQDFLFNVTCSLSIWEDEFMSKALDNAFSSWFLITPPILKSELCNTKNMKVTVHYKRDIENEQRD